MAMSALRTGDFDQAEHALCRVVVMSSPESEFAKISLKTLKDWKRQFHGIQPYSQLEGGELKRWDKHGGAIKVWVSDGLELPRGFNGPDLTANKCKTLYPMIDRPGFIEQLKTTQHYFPDYRGIVEEGIKDWRWVAEEGIISFQIIDDPRKADVLFFFCPNWGGGHVGMTFYPWPGVANARCIAVIETEYLRSLGSRAHKELRKTSAHEFGHILGLTQHSPCQEDLMYGNVGKMLTWMESKQYSDTSSVTRNDYVTLRALYELPPDNTYITLGR